MSAAHFAVYHLTQFFTSLGQLSAESDETKPLLSTFGEKTASLFPDF